MVRQRLEPAPSVNRIIHPGIGLEPSSDKREVDLGTKAIDSIQQVADSLVLDQPADKQDPQRPRGIGCRPLPPPDCRSSVVHHADFFLRDCARQSPPHVFAGYKNVVCQGKLFVLPLQMPCGIHEIGKKPGELRAALGFLREQVAHPVPIAAGQLVNCLDAQPLGFAEGLACAPFIGIHNIGTQAANAPRHLAVQVPVDANDRKGPLS